jgi:predicted ester cyclase
MRLELALVAVVAGGVGLTASEQEAPASPPVAAPNPEQHKAQARRVFEDLFSHGRYDQIDQIYDKGCKVHFGNRTASLDQVVAEGKGWRDAAPDLVMSSDEVTASDDIVTVKWTAKATHTGNALGLKPTNKKVVVHGTSRFRFVNGKIVEAWNTEYRDDLFRQVGVPKATALLFEHADDLRWTLFAE